MSGAITLFYVTSALLLIPVGGVIGRAGPQPIFALGGTALALGVAAIGHVTAPWQAYAVFLVMGIGWACLSTTAVATTLAPWFERFQGRAVSVASLGASVGGMNLDADRRCSGVDSREERLGKGVVGVEQRTDALCGGHEFAQELDVFRRGLRRRRRYSGDVSSRMGEARDQTGSHRVADPGHHDGDVARDFLGGLGRRGLIADDDLRFEPDQFPDGVPQALRISAARGPDLEHDVLMVDVAQLPQSILELFQEQRGVRLAGNE